MERESHRSTDHPGGVVINEVGNSVRAANSSLVHKAEQLRREVQIRPRVLTMNAAVAEL